MNTHPEQWAANAVAPGEQLGVRCLVQGHLSRGIEGGERAVHSLPHLQFLPDLRLEPATFGLRVRLSKPLGPCHPNRMGVMDLGVMAR